MTDTPSVAILEAVEMAHHMLCAYVGPVADFRGPQGADVCPKCHRALKPGAVDWEILTVTTARSP